MTDSRTALVKLLQQAHATQQSRLPDPAKGEFTIADYAETNGMDNYDIARHEVDCLMRAGVIVKVRDGMSTNGRAAAIYRFTNDTS